MCGDDVCPIRVVRSDNNGKKSVGLGSLHKVLAQDPALGLAGLRGLKEWEHGRMCSKLWSPWRPYKPSQWVHLAEVGWLGCEDGRIWREMGGGEAKGVKEEREGASTTTTPTPPPPPSPTPPPPPKTSKGGKATTGKKRKKLFESDLDDESEHPASSSSSSSGEDSHPPKKKAPTPPARPKTKAVPTLKERGGGGKKGEGGGKEAGGEKKEEGGGEPNDPLVGTTTHVPYGGGVEVGTVTGVHTRNSGVVWVKHPSNPNLYEVECHLIFGTAEAAEAHLQKVRKGKTPTTNPPPPHPQRSPLTPRHTPKKTCNPTKIPPPTHLTPQPQPKVPRTMGPGNGLPRGVTHVNNGPNGQGHEPPRLMGMYYVFLCLSREVSFLENWFKFSRFNFASRRRIIFKICKI